MIRKTAFLLFVTLLVSCGEKERQAPLSGVMWGGEGNRIIIMPASGEAFRDTLLIDNHGMFAWTPDTLIPGFYILEKSPNNHLVLVMEDNRPVSIDAQYISFPKNCKVTGSDNYLDFYQIETLSKKWQKAMQTSTSTTIDSVWKPTAQAVEKLKQTLDSITQIYREEIVQISDEPLVRMFGLLQTAGNKRLFDPWAHKELYFAADSMLEPFSHLREVKMFRREAEVLYNKHLLFNKLQPGTQFPEIILSVMGQDTLSTSDFLGSPLYIELYEPGKEDQAAIHQKAIEKVNSFQWRGMKAAFLLLDSITLPESKRGFNSMNLSDGLSPEIMEQLGVVSLPANFILSDSGIIAGKNLWDKKLQELMELLVKK